VPLPGQCTPWRVINVGERFADASIRLVRDIPMRSSAWKSLYPRARNAVEGRNATFEGWVSNACLFLVCSAPKPCSFWQMPWKP